MNDRKLKRAIERTAEFYQRIGYRFSFAGGMLGEFFSLTLDSVYNGNPGLYLAVFVDRIPEDSYKRILAYQTIRNKEIALWVFNKKVKNDSGKCATYRIQGNQIVEYPAGMPIEKMLSSPSKQQARSSKV